MSEEKKDPKEGEEKQPTGTGQPEKKDADEKVEVSKSELETLRAKSKDFEGLSERLKKKERAGRTIPGAEIPVKKEDKSDDGDGGNEEFVTKKDLDAKIGKQIETAGIAEACKNPIVDDHYQEVLEFLIFRPGERDTVEGIASAFNRAAKVWKSENPSAPTADRGEGDQKVISDLAADKGLGEGKEKKPEPEKKSILRGNKTPMKDWYPKK